MIGAADPTNEQRTMDDFACRIVKKRAVGENRLRRGSAPRSHGRCIAEDIFSGVSPSVLLPALLLRDKHRD